MTYAQRSWGKKVSLKKKSGKRRETALQGEEGNGKDGEEEGKKKVTYEEKKLGLEKSIASDFEFTKELIGKIDFLDK